VWYAIYVVVNYIQWELNNEYLAALGDKPHREKKVCVIIPADPTSPVRLVGHKCDLKVLALAVDIRARKREALIEDDIPQDAKEAQVTCDVNWSDM